VKWNQSGMSYTVDTVPVQVKDGGSTDTPRVVWLGEIDGTADDALTHRNVGTQSSEPRRSVGRPNDKLQRAIQWLAAALQDGLPHEVKVLRRDAKESEGIAPATLDKARESMSVKVAKLGPCWCWQINPAGVDPDADPSDPELVYRTAFEVEGA
jgi:hypothetical protein